MRFLLVTTLCLGSATSFADDTIRSQAVVDLSFDANDKLADTRGKHPDTAIVKGKPQLISSPFWNQKGKELILDPGSKQYVEVADSPDTDRPTGVTVSTFFLSLHPLTQGGPFHGIFAKRGDNTDSRTNYGINYLPTGDAFQVYIHDGTGFKVARYSVKGTIGFSKLVHLTATFEVADAPGTDTDTDADDVRIRVFINGKIIKPVSSSAGFVEANDTWITNVNVQKLLNDVPLTIGSSFSDQELTAGVYDEFLVFDKALPPADVAKLFVELTGSTAEQIAKQEQQQKQSVTARPVITTVTPRGLQTGAKTRVTITGTTLQNANVFLSERLATTTIVESTNSKLVADVVVPPTATPGFYPLRVYGEAGLSKPVVVAVDRMKELTWSSTSVEKPAALPAAFSGTVAGTQEVKIWFNGKKGQRVVADVESQRLGSNLDPVVEIKNSRGTPLGLEWRKHELHGDTRVEVTLPADGTYFVELHDLAYRAPGNSPFRVRVGDLKVIDQFLPRTSGDETVLTASGTGIGKTKVRASPSPDGTLSLKNLPDVDGPLPRVENSDATEIAEVAGGKKQPDIDTTFAGTRSQAVVAINGTVSEPNEADVFNLKVAEGTKLYFNLQSRSLGSPLDGTLRIFNGKQLLSAKDTGGTGNDIGAEITVPKGAKNLRVRISDFARRGGATHVYRLLISKSGRSDFRISAQSGTVEIPENGSVVMRLSVVRSGGGFAYAGPIRLSVEGDNGLQITPAELPAESPSRDVFVVLSRTGPVGDQISPISIIAESARGPAVRTAARVPTTAPVVAAEFDSLVAAEPKKPVDASINIAGVPPILFRGTQAILPIQMTALTPADMGTVRFRLMSTERPRNNKPLVRAVPNQFVTAPQSTADLKISVPFDQVDPFMDVVIVGELVQNPFAPVAKASVYSAPIRMMVQTGVRVAPAAGSLTLKAGGKPAVTGTVVRRFGFAEPVRLSIAGLPKGYSSPAVVVPENQRTFSIPVTLPKGAKPGGLKNVQLVAQSVAGTTIAANQPLALKVAK